MRSIQIFNNDLIAGFEAHTLLDHRVGMRVVPIIVLCKCGIRVHYSNTPSHRALRYANVSR